VEFVFLLAVLFYQEKYSASRRNLG